MQSERIYSAPSLVEVIKQLLVYRLSGVLTLWPAKASRQEQVRITIEQGRPLRIFWGATHQENISSSILEWLNTWGEIHFSFLPTNARLQLPSPVPYPPQPLHQTQQAPRSAVTQPLPALSSPSRNSGIPSNNGTSAFGNPETIVAFLTPSGQRFPASNLPRYERTIFLLVNGRRTLVNLAQLTKRTPDEVYATLSYLYNMRLITIDTLPL